MGQNKYHDRPQLPNELMGKVNRIVEEMRIEGISVLELPEQLMAILIMEIVGGRERDRWKENPFLYEEEWERAKRAFMDAQRRLRDAPCFDTIWNEIRLISSRQVLMNLWDLGEWLCRESPGLSQELEGAFSGKSGLQSQVLAETMDYLAEAIHHRGDRGFFFTPYNLAVLVTELVNPGDGKIWDPSFGSGILLIQAAKKAEQNTGTYCIAGNEINHRMVRFAHINAFCHGIAAQFMEFGEADTIEESRRATFYELYDYIIANPPVSSVSDNTREEFGFLAPTRKLHLQFLQVILMRLKQTGRAAIFVNENFLFARSRTEKKIREALVENFGLRTVISLPQGAFAPYTYAKASILFLDRSLANEQPVSFYELKALGYTLDKRGQQISENDIPQVLDAEAHREDRYMEWENRIKRMWQYNEQGIVVPADWQYETGWFADRKDIRDKEYSLMGTVYSMREKELREPEASPGELLRKLGRMEAESQELLDRLFEMNL
ncbi:MAG: SAM-dependent methyltransferase [Blautia sp.]|nr:SAM-dependent methyltransferase [Blautia sp.]